MDNWATHKKQVIAFALASLVGSMAASPARAQSNAQVIELNNEGVRALGASNFNLAIEKFEAALKLDPSYTLARNNLGIAYNNKGLQLQKNPMAALTLFHKAFFLDPTNATTKQNVDGIIRYMNRDPKNFQDRVDLGDTARKSGDFIGAAVEYSAAVSIKDDAGVREKLGDVYRVQDRLDRAIIEYKNAIRIKDSAIVEVKLGQAFQAKNDVANAIQCLGVALKLNSTDPDVLDALVTAWDEAVRQNPTSPDNHVGLGQALMYRGDYDQSKEELLQAIRFSPGRRNPAAEQLLQKLPEVRKKAELERHVNNGVDLQSQGKFDAALEEYKAALVQNPNSDKIWVNIGTCYQAKKDYPNALQAYKQALNFNKANADATQGLKTASEALQDQQIDDLSKRANDMFKAGKYDEAIAAYMQLLKFDPNDAATHFNLGAAYQQKKDLDAAIAEYRTAKTLDAKNKTYTQAYEDAMDLKAQPLIDQGLAAHKDKKYAQAIEFYIQALNLRPQNDEVWYNLGAAQYSREDYKNSEKSYQKAFELDPKGRVDVLYFIGTIDENFGSGPEALTDYKTYIQKAPSGTYVKEAKERIAALTKDISDTNKIKSESDLAKEKDAIEAYKQAVDLQSKKQYDQALPLYQKAIAAMPDQPDYIYTLGTLFQNMDKYDDAIAQYQKAKVLAQKLGSDTKIMDDAIQSANQDKAQPIVDQAVAKQQAGDNAAAIPLYQQALQLIPENGKLWTNLGAAYQQTDQFAQARQAYESAYKADAKSEIGSLYLMAVIDENSGNGQQAKGLYDLYIKNAGSSATYYALAKARSDALAKNIKDTQKLATTADIAAAKTAEDAYKAGMKLSEEKKYDEAVVELQKAAQAVPTEFAYPFAIGIMYQQKGDIENAKAAYNKAMSLAKSKDQQTQVSQALTGLTEALVAPILNDANTKYGASDFAGAAEKYEAVLKITPNDADAWTFMGASYQNLGDFAKARNAYEQGFKLGGKAKADNLYYLGVLDENDGALQQALQHYTMYIQNSPTGGYRSAAEGRLKALRANPKDMQRIQTAAQQKQSAEIQTLYAEAVQLQTDKKYDEALTNYNKLIELSPQDASFYYGRGTLYQTRSDATKNDVDSAISDYNKAIGLAPADKTYKETLKGLLAFKAQPLVDEAIKKQTTADAAGKYDLPGAIADYRAAIKIAPDVASTHFNLATALQGNADNAGALQEYTATVNLDPTYADAYLYRGGIYEEMKQNDAAKKDYQKYLQLQPAGPNAATAKDGIKRLTPAAPGRKK